MVNGRGFDTEENLSVSVAKIENFDNQYHETINFKKTSQELRS